jgi:hypothetical protein
VSDIAKADRVPRVAGIFSRAREHPVIAIAVLLGCFLLAQWNFFSPFLRLGSSRANIAATILFLLLPWLGLRYCFALPKWWQTTIALLVLLPALLFTVIGGFVIWIGSHSIQRSTRIEMGAYRVVIEEFVYGGAAGGEAVDVRQERTLLPGLLLVRRLDTVGDADIASYRIIGPNELRIELSLWGMKPGQSDFEYHQIGSKDNDYRLKSFVYF